MRLDNNTFKRLYENAHDVQSGISETKKLQEDFTAKAYALTEQYAEQMKALAEEYDLQEETPSDPFVRAKGYKRRPIGKVRPAPGVYGNFQLGHTDRDGIDFPYAPHPPTEGEMYDGSEEETGPPTYPGQYNPFGPPGSGRYIPEVIGDVLDYLAALMSSQGRRPVVYKGEPGGGGLSGLDMMAQAMTAPTQGEPFQP